MATETDWVYVDFETTGHSKAHSSYGHRSADDALVGIKEALAFVAVQCARTATFELRPAGTVRGAQPSARLDITGCARDGLLTTEQEATIRRRLAGPVAPWLVLTVALVDRESQKKEASPECDPVASRW